MSDATKNPKTPNTITLIKPLKNGSEEITELDFREFDLGVLTDIDIVFELTQGDDETGKPRSIKIRVDLGHIPRLIANATNLPLKVARQVSFMDALKIGEAVLGFIMPSPETGGK